MDRLFFVKADDWYYRGGFWQWTKNWRKAAILSLSDIAHLVKHDNRFTFYEILSPEEVVNGMCMTYRPLTSGDVVRVGDEIRYNDNSWHTVVMFFGEDVGSYTLFRRKITLDN